MPSSFYFISFLLLHNVLKCISLTRRLLLCMRQYSTIVCL